MNNTTYFVATEGKTGRDDSKRGLVWLAIDPLAPGEALPASSALVTASEVLKLYDAKTRHVAVPAARWAAMLTQPARKHRLTAKTASGGLLGWLRSILSRPVTA